MVSEGFSEGFLELGISNREGFSEGFPELGTSDPTPTYARDLDQNPTNTNHIVIISMGFTATSVLPFHLLSIWIRSFKAPTFFYLVGKYFESFGYFGQLTTVPQQQFLVLAETVCQIRV